MSERTENLIENERKIRQALREKYYKKREAASIGGPAVEASGSPSNKLLRLSILIIQWTAG
jgi:hypothetical protein